jgi:hypothetical protein
VEADIEVAEISTKPITSEGPFVRCGGKFLYELQPGDTWALVMGGGGIIVTHVDRGPSWVKLENGVPVVTELTAVNPEANAK